MNSRVQRGFGLIELMVALVAGLIVSYAVVAFAMSSAKSNAEYVQSMKLTQSLRNTLDIVVRDMRRAGYDDNAVARLAGGLASPAVGASPLSPVLLDNSDATNGSCVIYAYDRAGGTSGAVDPGLGEVRGLRRRVVTPAGSATSVGVIEYAVSAGSRPLCSGGTGNYATYPAACNAGGSAWCPLTDPKTINITAFEVAEPVPAAIGANPSAVRMRTFTIALRGRLVGDNGTSYLNGVSTTFQRGVAAQVRVRSDCLQNDAATCNVSP
jgi:prepilin-type N-terminal cleavage/methylation domain-containing protein